MECNEEQGNLIFYHYRWNVHVIQNGFFTLNEVFWEKKSQEMV